jgi:hypothetical protein
MKNKAIVTALLCSAIALGTGLKNSGSGVSDTGDINVFETAASFSPLGANTAFGYILSTVSADFALPGRNPAV